MINRKIDKYLDNFFQATHKALLLTGARQIGKTYSIRQAAQRIFDDFVEINFITSPEAIGIFTGAKDVKDMLFRLTAFVHKPLVKGKTLIFFDEVQVYPEVVTLIKFLVDEGSYRYALSGSLLGIELNNLRSVFVPSSKTLLVSSETDDSQRMFIYAKEIAYNFLNITDRLFTFSWIKFDSFDQVLNNFIASYFAGALLIPRKSLVASLKTFFDKKTFSTNDFQMLMDGFTDSPETFYQRLTNVLPKDFNLKNLFFLRFSYKPERGDFQLTKELHITNLLEPHANERNEHYCRRWISLKTIQDLTETTENHVLDSQISSYNHTDNEYFVISSATKDPFRKGYYRSIALGIMINQHSLSRIAFLQDEKIKRRKVGVTCESCSISDCLERVAPPKNLERKARFLQTDMVVKEIMEKYK